MFKSPLNVTFDQNDWIMELVRAMGRLDLSDGDENVSFGENKRAHGQHARFGREPNARILKALNSRKWTTEMSSTMSTPRLHADSGSGNDLSPF